MGANSPFMATALPPPPALSAGTLLPLEQRAAPPSDILDQVGGCLSLSHSQWLALGAFPGVMESIMGLKL